MSNVQATGSPSIADQARLTARSRRLGAFRPAVAVLLAVALFAGACGSGADETNAPTPLVVVDPATGEPIEVPADFELDFGNGDAAAADDPIDDDLPRGPQATEPSAAGEASAPDTDRPGDGNGGDGDDADGDRTPPGGARGDAPHPLEDIVIETVEIDREAPPIMDEAADLACANTEFVRDALIEGRADDAVESFGLAAEWAGQSAFEPVRSLAEALADPPTGTAADDLVVAVLEACAAAGYEL